MDDSPTIHMPRQGERRVPGNLGGDPDRLLLADQRLLRSRIADAPGNVCISDGRRPSSTVDSIDGCNTLETA